MVLVRQSSTPTIAWVDFVDRVRTPWEVSSNSARVALPRCFGGRQRGTGSSVTTSARHPASCSGASAVGEPASFGKLASRHPSGPEQRFGARLGSAVARTSLARGPNGTRRTTPALVGTVRHRHDDRRFGDGPTGTPSRSPASVGEKLGRSLKRPEVAAGFGQHVSPGALPLGTA